jgi:hypothetical protein
VASAWGLAWGQNWGGSWGAIDGAAPPEPPQPPPAAEQPRGRAPWLEPPPDYAKIRHKSRVLHGIEEEIVERVAERQAEALDLDALQQKEELQGELRLSGIELESAHLEALAARREALISAEIGRRLRQRMDDEAAALILAIAVALD